MPTEPNEQFEALGAAIRAQRKLANLSLRQLASVAEISNPYLSQIERGLHAPSVHVLRSIARALSLSAETLQEQAGMIGEDGWPDNGDGTAKAVEETELALRKDPWLSEEQKAALLAVYRSYREANLRSKPTESPESDPVSTRPAPRRTASRATAQRPSGARAATRRPPAKRASS